MPEDLEDLEATIAEAKYELRRVDRLQKLNAPDVVVIHAIKLMARRLQGIVDAYEDSPH